MFRNSSDAFHLLSSPRDLKNESGNENDCATKIIASFDTASLRQATNSDDVDELDHESDEEENYGSADTVDE